MYGEAYPSIVYGFNMGNRDLIFDEVWLYKNFEDIECFAVDIVRNHLGEAIYGIQCYINIETGIVNGPIENNKDTIKKLYDKYIDYLRITYKSQNYDVKLGYHLAVRGWDEQEHETIILDL